MTGSELLGSWGFQAPNWILAALMYTLLGRFVLSFIFKPDSDMVIWRVFKQVTDPIINITRTLTPHLIADKYIVLLAFAWLLFFRTLLVIVFLLG